MDIAQKIFTDEVMMSLYVIVTWTAVKYMLDKRKDDIAWKKWWKNYKGIVLISILFSAGLIIFDEESLMALKAIPGIKEMIPIDFDQYPKLAYIIPPILAHAFLKDKKTIEVSKEEYELLVKELNELKNSIS